MPNGIAIRIVVSATDHNTIQLHGEGAVLRRKPHHKPNRRFSKIKPGKSDSTPRMQYPGQVVWGGSPVTVALTRFSWLFG